MVAGPCRQFGVAQLFQFAPHGRFIERHGKFLMQPLDQVGQSPADDTMDRRDRTALHDLGKGGSLFIVQFWGVAWRLAINKPIWPFGVEAFDPVANDLTPDAADPSGSRTTVAIVNH